MDASPVFWTTITVAVDNQLIVIGRTSSPAYRCGQRSRFAFVNNVPIHAWRRCDELSNFLTSTGGA